MARGDLDDFELERTPYTPPDEREPAARDARRGPAGQSPRPSDAKGPRPGATGPRVLDEGPDLPVEEAKRLDDAPSELGEGPLAATPLGAAPERGSRLFMLTLAAIALIAFGVLLLLFVVFRQPTPNSAPVAGAPATTPARPAASAEPGEAVNGPLPDLEASDEFVRRLAASLSAHPEFTRWLGRTALVRTLAAVVTNVADGETPRPHLEFLAPAQRFRAASGPGRRIVADPAGFAGYDRFADAIASVDAASAVAAYRASEPLFDAAYRELGHPEGGFRSALDQAISALLAAPVPPADAELVPHAIGFRYADPRLEALTPAQKQFLRIGPRNVSRVQAKLREVRSALGTAEQPPASDRTR